MTTQQGRRRKIVIRLRQSATDLSFIQSNQTTGSGSQHAFYPVSTRGSLCGGKVVSG